MRLFLLICVLCFISLAHAETLVIGTPPFSPPFEMAADNKGELIGFSIEIVSNICKRLDKQYRFQLIHFNKIMDSILRGYIDMAVGNITITQEREQFVAFSLPYLPSEAQFIRKRSDHSVESTKDFEGKTIGIERTSVFEAYLKKHYNDSVKITNYTLISDIMSALESGNIEVALLDKETANFWVANNSNVFELIGEPIPIGLGIGIMLNKNNSQLLAGINQSLLDMQSDGTYLKIYNAYFGPK